MATVLKPTACVDKCPEKYDPYQPISSQLHRQIAKDELREEPAIVEQALEQMREWIAKNPAIQTCRTDANFLLRFLRVRKFSHVAACETLERYLVSRQRFPDWYSKLDTAEPWVKVMIDSEFVVPLGRDELGRNVGLVRFSNLDHDRFHVTEQVRFYTMIIENIIEDERNQTAGIVCVIDCTNISMHLIAQWSLRDIKNYVDYILNAFPVRVKGLHVINIPLYASTIVDWILSCCSEKIRGRLKFYPSRDEFISKCNLLPLMPKEYGGKQDTVDLKRQFEESLASSKHNILALDNMKVDEKRCLLVKSQTHPSGIDEGAIGSFRKLDID